MGSGKNWSLWRNLARVSIVSIHGETNGKVINTFNQAKRVSTQLNPNVEVGSAGPKSKAKII